MPRTKQLSPNVTPQIRHAAQLSAESGLVGLIVHMARDRIVADWRKSTSSEERENLHAEERVMQRMYTEFTHLVRTLGDKHD